MRNMLTLALLLSLTPAIAKNGGLIQVGSSSLNTLEDTGSGFPFTSSSVSTNLFDVRGNLIKTITLGFDGSVWDMASTITFFYDRHGDIQSEVQDVDYGLDGVVDMRSMVIYTNSSPNSRQQITLIDNDADGVNDEIVTRTYTFDNDARLIDLVTELDTDANGITDFRSVESWHYDFDNHQLFYTNTSDLFSVGVPKVIATATYVLNEDGDPISGTSSHYDPFVGLVIHGTANYTYDKFGNLIRQVIGTLLPNGLSGPIWEIASTDFFYSHRGLATRDLRPGSTTEQPNVPIDTIEPPELTIPAWTHPMIQND